MRVKSISYIHAYNVSGFLNDKAGMEIELNEGESEDEAFDFAIAKLTALATKVQNSFIQSTEFVDRNKPLPIHDISKEEGRTPEAVIDEYSLACQIDKCESLEDLGKLKKGLPPTLKNIFMGKMQFLNDKILKTTTT